MSILKIARMGHPVLHQAALPVSDFKNQELSILIEDMIETLSDSGGIGLAAPQVHVPKRIVIFFIPEERSANEESGAGVDLTIMLNPEIQYLGSEKNIDWEACLSVPGLMGAVERYSHIKYSWMDMNGSRQEREAMGFHARAVQHECDHLDGKLYPMRMNDFETFGFSDEVNKNVRLMDKGRVTVPEDKTIEGLYESRSKQGS
jgi:peptide deformylase